MTTLPIQAYEEQIIESVKHNQITIIAAETGAGKSTQVPLMLLRAGIGSGMIGITQPRRVAAVSVAEYVAELDGSTIGGKIGFQIRQEKKVSRETRVKFMTEGILLRELHGDPTLAKYDLVVVDEAHERGVNQDLILALLKKVVVNRPLLKVVVMSATIDEKRFADYFGGAPVIKVPGRVFPVELRYANETPPEHLFPERIAEKVKEICDSNDPGDILCFLPDEDKIKKACNKIEDLRLSDVRVLPLYGAQAPDEQREVFKRNNQRRIIVSTNIAETSLTIDGVRHVVDSGLIKSMVYVNASMSALSVVAHSKAGCDQRKGRAGRTQDGVCHRLFSREDFEERSGFTEPEILRMSLDQVFLHLRCLDYSKQEIIDLDFMDAPGEERWLEAEERLKLLGAMDDKGDITVDGRRMETFPLAPMLARMLLNAEKYMCVSEVATIVAALTARPVFTRPKDKADAADAAQSGFKDPTSDALTILNVWNAWLRNQQSKMWAREKFLSTKALSQIKINREHILSLMPKESLSKDTSSKDNIRKAIAAGLIVNLARKSFRFSYAWQGNEVFIHPSSAMFKKANPEFIVCAEVVKTTKTYARGCETVEPAWLKDLIPVSACKRRLILEKEWFGNGAVKMIEILEWQGSEIYRQHITELTPDHMPVLAQALVKSFTDYGDIVHPQMEYLRMFWRTLKHILGLDVFYWEGNAARDQEKQIANLKEKLAKLLTSQMDGVSTLAGMMDVEFVLRLVDFVSKEQAETFQAKIDEDARVQAEVEKQREKRRQEIDAEHNEREAGREDLRGKFRILMGRLESFPNVSMELSAKMDRLRYNLNYYPIDSLNKDLNSLEIQVNAAEKDAIEYKRLFEQISKTVKTAYPVCPICSGEWAIVLNEMVCSRQHTNEQLLTNETQASIALFTSDKDQIVAEVGFGNRLIRIKIYGKTGYWQGKKFKTITHKKMTRIIPEALVAHKKNMLTDLSAIEDLKLDKARQDLTIKSLGNDHKIITFKTENGVAVSQVGKTLFVAEYSHPYPDAGQSWVCKVGSTVEGTRTETKVKPIFPTQLNENSVEELISLFKEMYPGVDI